jgi:hypothetical protein
MVAMQRQFMSWFSHQESFKAHRDLVGWSNRFTGIYWKLDYAFRLPPEVVLGRQHRPWVTTESMPRLVSLRLQIKIIHRGGKLCDKVVVLSPAVH